MPDPSTTIQLSQPVPKRNAYYRTLDSQGIVRAIALLHGRINQRFQNSGLSNVAGELLEVSREAAARAAWIGRPNVSLRIGVATLLLVSVLAVGWLVSLLRIRADVSTLPDLLQSLEAGVNITLLAAAAIWSLVSLELRQKRAAALQMLHELRVLAHLVDMHQLTKDPESLRDLDEQTNGSASDPMSPRQLATYLDYCTDLLSLIGKIAALYAQYFDDRVVLQAVDEIETLSNSLARKIWQKIMLLQEGRQNSS